MRRIYAAALLLLISVAAFAQDAAKASVFHPEASKEAQVICGNARFTVLTPHLIRMEWAEDGIFEDRATLGIVNRNLPVPAFKVKKSSSKTVITHQ